MSNQKYICIDEEQWKKEFSAKLNKLVEQSGKSINSIANDICIDTKSLRNYLSGNSVPSSTIALKLAEYFEVSVDYLITNKKSSSFYFGNTIYELANIIKEFKVSVVTENSDYESVTIRIQDKLMAVMIREMMTCRDFKNYDEIVEKLVQSYGNMRIHNSQLVDYATFQNLVEHEYIYHDLEDFIMECVDDNGEDCLCIDEYTLDEIYERTDEWKKMTTQQREDWWADFQKEKNQ